MGFKQNLGQYYAEFSSHVMIQRFYLSKILDSHKSVIITGSPRSGTTWLAEILQQEKGAYMLFEPLSLKNKRVRKIGFDWRQFIPEGANWPEAESMFNDLSSGKYLTPWMLSHSERSGLLKADFFILKFVRANLLLPWLIDIIKPDRDPVFIVREPFSVVKSQLSHNWIEQKKVNFQLPVSRYSNEYYGQFEPILKKVETPVEFLIARWCLDNHYLLNHQDNDSKWITVKYEDLNSAPEREIRRICNRWKIDFKTEFIRAIDKKSKSSYGTDKVSASLLTTEDLDRGIKILRDFNLESLARIK